MKTIRLTIEYDGTGFVGWQIQANGRSVQGVLEMALAQVLGEPVRLVSSGRTDSGVHALGMVAHFVTGRDLPLRAYREGVNRLLPEDVAVREATLAVDNFHARFDARGKWYRYSIYRAPVRSPLQRHRGWHVRSPLDVEAMQRASEAMVGRHDFRVFRTSGCDARTTVREIFSIDLVADGALLHIDVKGDGFLRNMVRIMAGTLVEVGSGKRSVADVVALLRDGAGTAGKTAPPQGLCLMEVWYGEEGNQP